jgi:hypothetical protein
MDSSVQMVLFFEAVRFFVSVMVDYATTVATSRVNKERAV